MTIPEGGGMEHTRLPGSPQTPSTNNLQGPSGQAHTVSNLRTPQKFEGKGLEPERARYEDLMRPITWKEMPSLPSADAIANRKFVKAEKSDPNYEMMKKAQDEFFKHSQYEVIPETGERKPLKQ